MRDIAVVDTTLRDAHQCLWATRMTTAHMLPIAERMDRIGFQRIDLAGTIQFDVCMRYLKEDPWERMRLMRQRITQTPLSSFTRSKNLVSFDVLPDDIVEPLGRAAGRQRVPRGRNLRRPQRCRQHADDDQRGTPPGREDVRRPLLRFVAGPHRRTLRQDGAGISVKRGKVDAIWLKDAGGLLTVDRIRTLVPAIKAVIGNMPLELHSHCMTGVAPLVYLEGIKAGADMVHTSIAPLANGNAQPATQSMAKNLRALGFTVNMDDALVDEVGEHFRRIAEQEGKPIGMPQEYDAFHYEHQIPGGMMSNFRSQLAQAGLSHLLQKLLEECARVRHELGFPILITPFAQFVGTQAVLNVVQGERYRTVPDEVKKYALGYFGKLLAPVDPDVLDRIVANGSPKHSAEARSRLRRRSPGCAGSIPNAE